MKLGERCRKAWYRAITCRVPRVRRTTEQIREAGFTSQYGQDEFVFERLGRRERGIFFDIGAFDGVTLSNTCALERRFGWTGIAVEPSPSAFTLLDRERACITVHGCIASTPGTTRFLHIEGSAAMLSGVPSHYDRRHLARIDREVQADGGVRREIEVPCHTVNGLAERHGFSKIDYLSIDTEGGELAILSSVDFSRIDVNLVTVENNYREPGFRELMGRAGFRLIAKISCDEVYQHERHLP